MIVQLVLELNRLLEELQEEGLRGCRLEVEGWGDGIIDKQSMQIHGLNEKGLRFQIFSPGDQVSKVCLQDRCGQSAKTIQNM